MKTTELKELIIKGELDSAFVSRCGIDSTKTEEYRARVISAIDGFSAMYDPEGKRDVSLFSVGGRSEISGNHTDHNRGKVLAGAVNLDVIAVASKSDCGTVRVKSEGFDEDTVDESAILSPDKAKYYTSASIIAGMENAFARHGRNIGGFDAYTTSNVFKGSGLSSSAAFEVMIGNIINHLFNGGEVDNVTIAKMAQYAENEFFGKPCGLMDQTACAVGGFISIDFADPASPVISSLPFDLTAAGYALCIVNTGGNHADLNEDYASVPAEMKSVAAFFGKTVLREVSEEDVIANAAAIREKCSDRAILRALHFFSENKRVELQSASLERGDIDSFFDGVTASGNSSFKYLQNVYTTKNVSEQGLSLALCISERLLGEIPRRSACRVHGGGFAGTIQAFVPAEYADKYKQGIEAVFGEGQCHILKIRPSGAIKLA